MSVWKHIGVCRVERINRSILILPSVEGINPPNLIRPRVEVEDVDSDNEDDDEYVESVNAPSTNLGGGKLTDENTEAAPQLGRGARVRNLPD